MVDRCHNTTTAKASEQDHTGGLRRLNLDMKRERPNTLADACPGYLQLDGFLGGGCLNCAVVAVASRSVRLPIRPTGPASSVIRPRRLPLEAFGHTPGTSCGSTGRLTLYMALTPLDRKSRRLGSLACHDCR